MYEDSCYLISVNNLWDRTERIMDILQGILIAVNLLYVTLIWTCTVAVTHVSYPVRFAHITGAVNLTEARRIGMLVLKLLLKTVFVGCLFTFELWAAYKHEFHEAIFVLLTIKAMVGGYLVISEFWESYILGCELWNKAMVGGCLRISEFREFYLSELGHAEIIFVELNMEQNGS